MPSYGRVSTRGTIPLSRSADYLGPMTRSVADAALVLHAIAGYDPSEVTSYDMPVQDYAPALGCPGRMRIGLARNFFFEGLDPQIQQVVDRAVSVFAKLGAEIHEVALPVSSDRTVIQAEAYACHAANMAATPELYLPETLLKLRMGANIDMETYIKARLSLDQIRPNRSDHFQKPRRRVDTDHARAPAEVE